MTPPLSHFVLPPPRGAEDLRQQTYIKDSALTFEFRMASSATVIDMKRDGRNVGFCVELAAAFFFGDRSGKLFRVSASELLAFADHSTCLMFT